MFRFLMVATLLFGSVVGFYWSFGATANTRKVDPIEIPSKALELGSVLVSNDMRWTVPMRNVWHESIAVRRLITSCECTGVSPSSFSIHPEETQNVRLRFDLSPSSRRDGQSLEWTRAEWPFSVSLTADIVGSEPMTWEVSGLVRSPFVLSSTKIKLPPESVISLGGSRAVTRDAAKSGNIIVRCVQPLEELELACMTDVATGRLLPRSNERWQEFELLIEPSSSVAPGHYGFDVVLDAALDAKMAAAARIRVEMTVVDDIEVSPRSPIFPDIVVGERAKKIVSVRSRLNEPFIINNIEIDKLDHQDDQISVHLIQSDDPDTDHELQIALETQDSGYSEYRIRLHCFYPDYLLSRLFDFFVVGRSTMKNS